MNDMELAEEIERRATYIRYGMQVNREECEQIIAALRRGHELSEKAVAWLIIHYSGTGKAKRQEREVVLTPLTDDTYMDEGDEAWPLYMHPERPPSGEMVMVPKLVQQKDTGGCVVACLAMVTGLPYEEIRSKVFDFEKRDSANFRDTDSILYELGFAWQQVWLYGPGNKMRDPWPPKPWADVHMAEVRMPSGNTHSVVLLRNGDVLDPLNNAPSKLTDYPQIHSVRAIYRHSAAEAEGRKS